MTRGLLLNVAPIEFDKATVQVEVLNYQDQAQLRDLRTNLRNTHLVRRSGNQIVCVPIIEDAPELGYKSKGIDLDKDLYLAAALIRNALIDYLYELDRTILDYDPIKFLASGRSNDLLTLAVPKSLSTPEWLSVCLRYEAKVQPVFLDKQKPFVGLALNVRTMPRVTRSCADLAESGFSLKGLYVGKLNPHHDPRLAPRFRLAGRVRDVKDEKLLLDDARPELSAVDADEALLEPRLEAFDKSLVHVFGEQASFIRQTHGQTACSG